ncbi:uncharacterized protein LOC121779791 isoform X2 [Salvia splendens]|nr:uncharacterized protein LOC121779791 isoform X2 [Salvia splendens]XP_042033148.1 uncharacterized protein LOC121779791 isoform X2 [Salvia splendens]
MLQLYEASFLLREGEDTLELARQFATENLQKTLDGSGDEIDKNLSLWIQHSLEIPLHWRTPNLEAKWMIDAYSRRPDFNPTILELAKLDFNIVQATQIEELKDISRWWNNSCLSEKLPFVRDRLVESYFWAIGVFETHQHSYERKTAAKIITLITSLDDVYDIYGTLDELELFTLTLQRGVANSSTQKTIKFLIKSHKISVLAVIEPMTKPNPEFYSRKFGLAYKGMNTNGQIWLFTANGVEVDEWDVSEQVLHARFSSCDLPIQFHLSVVYGKCTRVGRHPLWNKLRELAVGMEGLPWLVGGDFNIFLSEEERQGSNKNRVKEMAEFADAVNDCQLLELGADGANFTWARGDILEKLDRALIGEGWLNLFSETRVTNLPRVMSDHSPLLIQCRRPGPPVRPPFRFQNMWVRHRSFQEVVKESWNIPLEERGLVKLQVKLSRLKKCLKLWNKNVFGNIFEKLKLAEEEAQEALNRFEQNKTPENRAEMNRTVAELILRVKMEEDYWKQKAAIRWSVEGERNSKFFQGWVKYKRSKARIFSIEERDQTLTEDEDIRASTVNFFQKLLSSDIDTLVEPDLDILSSIPAEVNMNELDKMPLIQEVRDAVFGICPDSASGRDGFSSLFYQKCWDIISRDVMEAVVDFFQGAQMPRGIAATMIILIPKKKNPTKWTKYRPISLCNVSNKIISKLLTSRMAALLPVLTAPNQSGFVRGRLLSDNVLLAKEMFYEIGKCNPSPNLVLKLDMAKAYDRVQWPFLLKVLKRMGFSDLWLGMIERCVNPCWFSVLINGSPAGFFKSSRGLRQGDPLSPSLFILAADYLSRLLDRLILGKKEMRFCTARYSMGVLHLAYADDIIIFTQARRATIRKINHCLKHYMEVSGQLINEGKNCFYIDEKHNGWAAGVKLTGGFQQGTLPCTYLGVPIFRGRKKTHLFMFLREKMSEKVQSWSHRHLSFGGRLTLIRSILQALPMHIFQVLEPTKGAIRLMEQVLARYFWGSCNTTNKTHWIKWEDVCRPTCEGGLGIRRMADTVEACSFKLWWRFREKSSLWAEYMHKKYWSRSAAFSIYRSCRFSPTWRRLFKAGSKCHHLLRWMLGKGNLNFWDDVWVKNQPLSRLSLREEAPEFAWVKDVWRDSEWNEEVLREWLGEQGVPIEWIEDILLTPFDMEEEDKARWTLTPHGNFTLASAWEQVRHRGEEREVFKIIWNKSITPTISVFMWRLLANRLPIDEKLQWRGVAMASKCRCCAIPKSESRLHLFVNGEAAKGVWDHFASWFPQAKAFVWPRNNVERRLRWWQQQSRSRYRPHVSTIIPCLILWYIWTERNGCIHRGTSFRLENVCYRVEWHLRNLVLAGHLGQEQWEGCEPGVASLKGRPARERPKKAETVQWRLLESPWLKLNSDGAFERSGNRGGGGGLLRNYRGDLVEAFSSPLEVSSGLEAEMMALLEGILMAKAHGSYLWLESDAEILCSTLAKGLLGPAETRHTMAKIRNALKGLTWKIT